MAQQLGLLNSKLNSSNAMLQSFRNNMPVHRKSCAAGLTGLTGFCRRRRGDTGAEVSWRRATALALRPSTSMRPLASARVAAAQRAHSIVLCTPNASHARLRSQHVYVAAAPPRASMGASLASGQRAASRCGAAFCGSVDLLYEEQPSGRMYLQVEGLEEHLEANKVCKVLAMPG